MHVNGTTTNGVNGKAKAKKVQEEAPAKPETVNISPKDYAPRVQVIEIGVRGISQLIVNHFGNKTREQMAKSQQGVRKEKKPPKDPAALFEASKYLDAKGRDCVPASAFRNAMIQAARGVDGVTMASLKQAIFIEGPDGPAQMLLPITYSQCVMREDPVRNQSGVADLRYRAAYDDWKTGFKLQIMENVLSTTQALQLLELAGFSVGICEWRPAGSKGTGGQFGRFTIAPK